MERVRSGRQGASKDGGEIMRTIAVANQKGGVAKTTTARETAAMLAEAGATVLMLDLDGQHDLTNFVLEGLPPVSVSDVMAGANIKDAIMETGRDRLHIVGATDRAYTLDDAIEQDRGAFRKALDPIRGLYDYCVIDFPRAASHAAIAALAASDVAVIPTETERASVNNAAKMLDLVDQVRDTINPSLRVAGVLITKYNPRTTINKQYEELLDQTAQAHGVRVFKARIPLATAVPESSGYGLTLSEHKPSSKPAQAYKDYLIELLSQFN